MPGINIANKCWSGAFHRVDDLNQVATRPGRLTIREQLFYGAPVLRLCPYWHYKLSLLNGHGAEARDRATARARSHWALGPKSCRNPRHGWAHHCTRAHHRVTATGNPTSAYTLKTKSPLLLFLCAIPATQKLSNALERVHR